MLNRREFLNIAAVSPFLINNLIERERQKKLRIIQTGLSSIRIGDQHIQTKLNQNRVFEIASFLSSYFETPEVQGRVDRWFFENALEIRLIEGDEIGPEAYGQFIPPEHNQETPRARIEIAEGTVRKMYFSLFSNTIPDLSGGPDIITLPHELLHLIQYIKNPFAVVNARLLESSTYAIPPAIGITTGFAVNRIVSKLNMNETLRSVAPFAVGWAALGLSGVALDQFDVKFYHPRMFDALKDLAYTNRHLMDLTTHSFTFAGL